MTDSFSCALTLAGRMAWRLIDADFACPCATQTDSATGGCEVGSSLTDEIQRIGGGCTISALFADSLPDCTESLVAWYPLAADKTVDYTRNHRTGTATGTLTTVSGVKCASATRFFWFDEIVLPSDSITPNQSFSISVWAKWDNPFQIATVYDRGNFQLSIGWLGTLCATVTGASSTVYRLQGATQIYRNRWVHLAASYTVQDGLRVYLDGVQDGFTEVVEPALQSPSGAIVGQFLACNLQDLRIYGDARSGDWWAAEWLNGCWPGFYTTH